MNEIFEGCFPALMTPCDSKGQPNYTALIRKATTLMDAGMKGVIYCGSMGDWPLLTDEQRQEGVARLCSEGIPVIVGTGAVNTASAVNHAVHAVKVGASGLMLIPRVLSRGTSRIAQRNHFDAILSVAPSIPSVIYNSPYYGFETKADLFFDLHHQHRNLVGFKEFGGRSSLDYASEHITNCDPSLILLVGVDTQVYHGYVSCGARGAITGIGNVLPLPVLELVRLCRKAATGDPCARGLAQELSEALMVLARFDEGSDLVLYYKYLLVLGGESEYEWNINSSDGLSASQQNFARVQLKQFQSWWTEWIARRKSPAESNELRA